VLLALGASVYRGGRAAARVAVAESNLRQVAVALELHFRKHLCYPPQGSDLAAALAPFLNDARVLANPLREEGTAGQTLALLYHAPSLAAIDRPNCCLTAFVSEDGTTAVVLKTGGIVERRDGLRLPADDLAQAAAALDPAWMRYAGSGDAGDADAEPPAAPASELAGAVNLNPKNNSDFEFELRRPDGSTLTRDDLLAAGGSLDFTGAAAWIRFTPKGSGTQSGLTLDGQPFPISNSATYVVQGGTIQARVYNDKGGKGKAMGRWWLAITASGASIEAVN